MLIFDDDITGEPTEGHFWKKQQNSAHEYKNDTEDYKETCNALHGF